MTATKSNATQDVPDPEEVAALIRRLLAAVYEGKLDPSGSAGARLVARLEALATAFEALAAGR
jgi:hypothetical protein